ncbi:DUF3306 domain-containing protein [Rhodoferax sp.]|uniref:DUF3306 domain-containing protein n=1 Tax=Rhodoferax sp. TaxID=50421 RepID=UPI00260BF1AB|nr:DUF3306 domain-containing protein [Rhodoferax sp.]MDD2926241.1 DUF3306 domain-containing protein [Rhodoferax sp.]
MADGFLGRWSQRKQAVREGKPLVEPVPKVVPSEVPPGAAAAPSSAPAVPTVPAAASTVSPQPAPTLDDVQALKPDDSFARFVARDVSPDVRNAAMKKLFADPHYNVMDGLDIYIDDYSKPSPLSAAALRQMASAKFLNLLEEEPPAPIGEDAHTATASDVAQSAPALPSEPVPTSAADDLIENTSHDHLDLRLQPDHAAGCAVLKREPERHPDAAFEPVPPRSG